MRLNKHRYQLWWEECWIQTLLNSVGGRSRNCEMWSKSPPPPHTHTDGIGFLMILIIFFFLGGWVFHCQDFWDEAPFQIRCYVRAILLNLSLYFVSFWLLGYVSIGFGSLCSVYFVLYCNVNIYSILPTYANFYVWPLTLVYPDVTWSTPTYWSSSSDSAVYHTTPVYPVFLVYCDYCLLSATYCQVRH